MLDHPTKTLKLMDAMKAALPFEVDLTPEALAMLRKQYSIANLVATQTVSSISYAGDMGGILCHMQPEGSKDVIVISLTHVRMSRSQPLSAAVFDYQKHRVKKLKKAGEWS